MSAIYKSRAALAMVAMLGTVGSVATVEAKEPPTTIALPAGFFPEGISSAGSQFYAGSLSTGAIYTGNVRTGRGRILVRAKSGRSFYGQQVDPFGRLVAVNGAPGAVTFFDRTSGKALRRYSPTARAATGLNGVIVTRAGAFATDSASPRLVVTRFGPHGALPATASEIPLTGDLRYDDDPATFEANGIATTPDGKALLVVQTRTGMLFRVDPVSGASRRVVFAGGPLTFADGLLREGRKLYVVQNQLNQIRTLRLSRDGRSATITGKITDPGFDVPTSITRADGALFAVNARFTTPFTPTTAYSVVRVDGR